MPWKIILSLFLALLHPRPCQTNSLKLTLRAGVLIAPPFAVRRGDDDGGAYEGFFIELLDRLKIFAARDGDGGGGFDLDFVLSDAPVRYDDALDLVANDCNTTENPNALEDCRKFDLIVGDYYVNLNRSKRTDLMPVLLTSSIGAMKYNRRTGSSYDTMLELEAAKETACVPEGTFLKDLVRKKYPGANYYICPTPLDCTEKLKHGQCALYVDDELLLKYQALEDGDLQVNEDNFITQYITWPLRRNSDMEKVASPKLKEWVYAAIENTTLDELYHAYFEPSTCPIGKAGENCTQYCDPKHGRADGEGKCVCESRRWSGDDCSMRVDEDLDLISPLFLSLGYAMFGVSSAAVIACSVWLHCKRYAPQVQAAQPFFLNLVLLGVLMSSSTIIAIAQQDSGYGPVPACAAIPWLFFVGFSITYGALLSKIWRVYTIFKASVKLKRKAVPIRDTLLWVGSILFVNVFILSVWTGLGLPHWVRTVIETDRHGDPLRSTGHCFWYHKYVFVGLLAALQFGLLAVACWKCYASRNIPTKFSEGKLLGPAIVSNMQLYLIGVPVVVIAMDEGNNISFFVKSALIFLQNAMVLVLIFGRLIYSVITNQGDVSTGAAIKVVCRVSKGQLC